MLVRQRCRHSGRVCRERNLRDIDIAGEEVVVAGLVVGHPRNIKPEERHPVVMGGESAARPPVTATVSRAGAIAGRTSLLQLFANFLLIAMFLAWTANAGSPQISSVDDIDMQQPWPPGTGNDGTMQLIVQAYVDSMLRELENEGSRESRDGGGGGGALPTWAAASLQKRMRAFVQHVQQHPALRERRLWVGRKPPPHDPFEPSPENLQTKCPQEPEDASSSSSSSGKVERKSRLPVATNQPVKRGSIAPFPAEEVCGTVRQWELLNVTTDYNAHQVELVNSEQFQQYIFVYRCVAQRGPCLGISPLYNSECDMRYGWVNMYHRRMDIADSAPQWGFVAAPHHCACKITPKFIPDRK